MAASTSEIIEVMEKTSLPEHQRQPHLKCPRCDSSNTKFCYYNNYSLSQPRHFCKSCKRYWTRGGTLRNVPVGGGCRKNKRVKRLAPATPSNAGDTATTSSSTVQQQTDLSSAANPMNNSMFYSLPTSYPGLNFPFSRFSTSPRVNSDISSGFDFHLPQINGLRLGFEYKDGFSPVKKMEDVISTSCSSAAVNPLFFGSSTFAASTSTVASLLASSLQHQKYTASGLKDVTGNFPGLMPPFDGMQMPEDHNGIKEKEGQNRMDWSLYPGDHNQIHDSTDSASSFLWNSSINIGSWFDPNSNVGSSVPSLI